MTTLRRSFGTDALNAGTPLTSPTSSSHSSSSSSMSAFSKPDAPLSAGGPRSASAMLGSWASSSSSSSSSGRRTARPSGLGDRLMGIDRGKRDSDRTWLREMEAQQQQQQEQSAAKAAPVCRYYITHGHCVYGEACGFDHPPSLEGLNDEPPALISSTARRITVPVVPRSLVAPSTPPSRRVSEADIGLGLPLTPSRAVNRKRERDLSPLKHALPQPARERDVRRPSLVATASAPAVLPPPQPAGLTQPAATVAKPNHPDAPPAVPVLPPMFYATYRRGSNGEVLDPSLIPHGVQLQKSLYYRTKPCRYWAADGSCPKGDKCTFIHDPSLGAATPDRASSSTPVQTVSIVEEPVIVVEEPAKVEKPKTKLRLPPMPPTSPSKAREPHPAWRVVGGGVTLANARTEDQMDEDAVEQELLGNVEPASPVVSTPAYEAIPQTGVHAHNGFPAYALPTHPVYAAYAYPTPAPSAASPVAYQAPSPAPHQVVYHAAPPAAPSPVAYQAPSPVAYQGAPVPEPGWAGWTMAVPAPTEGQVPYYAAMPMYGPPGVVYVPPGHQVQVAPAPEQRPFLAGVAPQPVLYGTTPNSVTYGVPLHDGRTVEVLAESGIDVSRLDGRHEETFGELDGYGVTSHADAFGAHDEDEMEVELEVNMGVIGQGMVSSVAPAPAPLKAKWSWADEVEEADPQWSPTPVQPEHDQASEEYQHQCATTPNSPRMRGRLFNAESP